MRIFKFNGEEIIEPMVVLIEDAEDATKLYEAIYHLGRPSPGLLIKVLHDTDPEAVIDAAHLIFERYGDPNFSMSDPEKM